MPLGKIKRRRRRTYKKRPYKRNYRRKRDRINYLKLRSVTGFPDQMVCKLKYNTVISMVNVSGHGSYRLNLNSLYDPDDTGAGHQPMGFDQYAAIYQDYEVRASSIYVKPLPIDANVCRYCVYPSNQSTAVTHVEKAIEQPYSRKGYITTNQTATNSRGIKNYMTVKKLEGRNIDSLNYIANTGSNPALLKHWFIIVDSVNLESIADISFEVTLIYYARFLRKRTLAQS